MELRRDRVIRLQDRWLVRDLSKTRNCLISPHTPLRWLACNRLFVVSGHGPGHFAGANYSTLTGNAEDGRDFWIFLINTVIRKCTRELKITQYIPKYVTCL